MPSDEVPPVKLRRLLGRGDDEGDDEREDAPGVGATDAGSDEDVEGAGPGDGSDATDGELAASASASASDTADPADPGSADSGGDHEDDGGDGEGEDEDDGDVVGEDERGTQIAFELGEWGARERSMLDDQLGALRVARAWEAGTLVVDRTDADVVDDLIDEIDERISLDLSPDVEPVTYGVGDWPAGLEDRFIEALIEARVPHQRGYREITVGVDDEERVDGLVESVSAAWADEQPTDEELEGPDAQQVLSELFVGSDRLQHDPSDRTGTVRFDDAADDVEAMGVPFGFDEGDWGQVVERVGALRALLSEPGADDEDIVEAARELRSHLRPLV